MTTIPAMEAEGPRQLLSQAAAGDSFAWNELVERYDRLVWHVILGAGLVQQDAADVHQTTWLRLAESLDAIREPESVGAWLATTARRESWRLSEARSKEVSVGLDVVDPDSSTTTIEDGLLTSERDAALWRAFSTLPRSCQQLLRLLLAEPPFTYDEISAILDLAIGSIGPTRRRCLDRLARSARVPGTGDQP